MSPTKAPRTVFSEGTDKSLSLDASPEGREAAGKAFNDWGITLMRLEKNARISGTRKVTKLRHGGMSCRVYQLKVDKSHLTTETTFVLNQIFIEAKWFYNAIIAWDKAYGTLKGFDYKVKEVAVLNKDKQPETRSVSHLSSQIRQELIGRAKDNIRSLLAARKRGLDTGWLGFVGEVTSIPLKKYGLTHWFGNSSRKAMIERKVVGKTIRIIGIKQPLVLRGLEQIPQDAELCNANLIKRGDDFYVYLTTYQPKVERMIPFSSIGIDFGVKNKLTLSNGIRLDIDVPVSEKIKKLERKLARQVRGSKRWWETKDKLRKAYWENTCRKTDARNKIVSYVTSRFKTVAFQDDNIAGWQQMWGRQVTSSTIGGIKAALEHKAHTPFVVKRFTTTTAKCSTCGAVQQSGGLEGLDERIFRCEACGLVIDRDLNAAINMELAAVVPTVRRESMPVSATSEMLKYFNSISFVSAGWVGVAGRQLVVVRTS